MTARARGRFRVSAVTPDIARIKQEAEYRGDYGPRVAEFVTQVHLEGPTRRASKVLP